MSKFTASIIFSDRLVYKHGLDSWYFVLLYPVGGTEAENPKPVCKELMIAKECKDLRDESHLFAQRERHTERVSECNEYY